MQLNIVNLHHQPVGVVVLALLAAALSSGGDAGQ